MRTMKMWIGNLDGERQGLVIAPSIGRAREIAGASRREFADHWVLQAGVDQGLEFEVLYAREMRTAPRQPDRWSGR